MHRHTQINSNIPAYTHSQETSFGPLCSSGSSVSSLADRGVGSGTQELPTACFVTNSHVCTASLVSVDRFLNVPAPGAFVIIGESWHSFQKNKNCSLASSSFSLSLQSFKMWIIHIGHITLCLSERGSGSWKEPNYWMEKAQVTTE